MKLSSPANLFDKSLFTFCACEKVNACADAYISPDIISVADVKPIVDIFCNVAPIANSSFVAVPDNTFLSKSWNTFSTFSATFLDEASAPSPIYSTGFCLDNVATTFPS